MFDEAFTEVRRAALGANEDPKLDGEFEQFRRFTDALTDWLLARHIQPTQLQAVPSDDGASYSLLVHVALNDRVKLDSVIADMWFWLSQRVPLNRDDLAILFSCGFDHRATVLTAPSSCAICVQPDVSSPFHVFPPAHVWLQLAGAIRAVETS